MGSIGESKNRSSLHSAVKRPTPVRIHFRAGVVGRKKFQYDVWGDAVNIASRMESHSVPGKIYIIEATRRLIKDEFICEHRGAVRIKGKGEMETWFLTAQNHDG